MYLKIKQYFMQIYSILYVAFESITQKLLFLLLGAAAGLFLIYHIIAIPYRYPLDYGKRHWLTRQSAWQTVKIYTGQTLRHPLTRFQIILLYI